MKRFLILMAAALLLIPGPALAQSARATASAPVHDEGTVRPLSQTLSGALRVINPSTGAAAQQVQGTAASGATEAGNPVGVACQYQATPPTFTTGQRAACMGDQNGSQRVVIAPSLTASSAITPTVTAAAAGSLIAKASAGNLYDWHVTTAAQAGFVLVFNSATVPADGAVTPLQCVAVPANATVSSLPSPVPDRHAAGIVVVFSSTGCFTKTTSATAFLRARVQ